MSLLLRRLCLPVTRWSGVVATSPAVRGLHVTPQVYVGTTRGTTPLEKWGESKSKLLGKTIDASDEAVVNIDALINASTTPAQAAEEGPPFQPFPDDRVYEQVYNGIKFKDLPYVTIQCRPHNIKFTVFDAQHKKLIYGSPRMFGFVNAAKRTDVAAQTTGMNVGQKLRNQNMRTVRVRIDGFNKGRIAGVMGLTQAGIQIVSVSDVTPIDWGWCQRAKKRKRQN